MPNNTISQGDIQNLKRTIPVQYFYASQLGQPQKHHDNTLTYFCPFHHDDKTPHFIITIGGQYHGNFKCFYCDEGGDVIRFHMLHNHFTFPEAYNNLFAIYGLPDKTKGA